MVYELDFSSRQLRLLKENVFSLEHRLTEQIHVTYERELNQTRMELAECRRKFQDFQQAMSTVVTADVRENINSIDAIMKGKAEAYKGARRPESTTINIISIKNVQAPAQGDSVAQAQAIAISELEHQV